jgi:hypothetical protein
MRFAREEGMAAACETGTPLPSSISVCSAFSFYLARLCNVGARSAASAARIL